MVSSAARDLDVFRADVREFIARELPQDIRAYVAAGRAIGRARQTDWQRRLWRRGWIAPGWPVELGGCDWGPAERHVFDEECVAADAPFVNPFGLFRAAPVIIAFGTDEQKRRFLPGILDSSTWWCQGYSEPGAGSDLAALGMRAERDGDHYIVTGTKTWTTQAQDADWMFCLVRSGPGANPREGISFLLVDLASPGIRVCPIELLDHRPHVNEVHFDRVRVPVAQRIGAEGQGWACSNVVLAFERLQIAEVPQSRRLLARLIALSRGIAAGDGTPMIEQPAWRQRLADAAAQLAAHAAMHQCILRSSAGREPGPEVSMLKLRGAELRQLLNELIIELLGTAALDSGAAGSRRGAAHEGLVHEFLYSRASTVYGGSNEIQRNLIARRVLGLG